MSEFIKIEDYDASIHREILDALVREDNSVIEICEDRAIEQMRSYLSRRYDCNAVFCASGDKRNALVLMMAIDIAVYHIFCLANPLKLSQMRKDRYERALEWLKQVADGGISVDIPQLPDDIQQKYSQFVMISNSKRQNRF